MKQARILIVIPAYNEAENLPFVLKELREHCHDCDVLVVDDGSTDATADVAVAHGLEVIRHGANLGYGAALRTGYARALSRRYAVVITMDADGQHDPSFVPSLVEPVVGGVCDVAVGARCPGRMGYAPSWPRRAGIRLFAWLGTVLTGRRILDPTSGFVAANPAAVRFLLRVTPDDYPDLNVRIALFRAGYRVREVPVLMRDRQAGRSVMMAGLAPFLYGPKMLVYLVQTYCLVRREHHASQLETPAGEP